MDASEIVLRIRDALPLTRADLARLAEVSPSTIGRIEKRSLDPTWGTLTRLLETSGFRIEGEDIVPLGDRSAAVAARLELDRVLGFDDESVPALAAVGSAQVWLERWRRIGWITDHPTELGLSLMAQAAARISGPAGGTRTSLHIGDAGRWREIALRIDEIGADYAVSNLATAHELPQISVLSQPTIYVQDLATVAALLREEESATGHGVLLIDTDGVELEGAVEGYALRFTSVSQALVDGFLDTGRAPVLAVIALSRLLFGTPSL